MAAPREMPIGLVLSRTAKVVERAFDDALSAAGGSRPMWLILLALRRGAPGNQVELADAVGIRGATLTHHLNTLEEHGLVRRTRRPDNRRLHLVELTAAGRERFDSLVGVARAHDRRLRSGLDTHQLDQLRATLQRMSANVADLD